MEVENAIYPGPTGLEALAASAPVGPIVMINLLKFREQASYNDGRPDNISGREAYLRYGAAMQKIVESAGGRFLFSGPVHGLVIGEVGELWDMVALVEYPSCQAFQRIVASPEVQKIGVHREAGLAGQLLIMTTHSATR